MTYIFTNQHRQKMSIARLGKEPWNKGTKGVMQAWNKGKKLSQEHIDKLSESHFKNPNRYWLGKRRPMGENSANWKGGVTRRLSLLRSRFEWKQWRKTIFQRDGYKCFDCGDMGYLEPHHIIPLKVGVERAFDVNNGITLCRPCHKKTMGKEVELARTYFSFVQCQV